MTTKTTTWFATTKPDSAPRILTSRTNQLLPFVLSTTAGAVDVIIFLALAGLFTAHITGNVVIVAVHVVTGRFGELGPLLAVPAFILVLGSVMLASAFVEKAGYSALRGLLILQAVLLAACLSLAVWFGPFADADRPIAWLVGMVAVSAMATQNALVKIYIRGVPSTAVMAANVTELTFDLALLFRRIGSSEDLARARQRIIATIPCIIGFVVGCAAGAALEIHFGLWALVLPVGLAVIAVPLSEPTSETLGMPS